LSLLGLAGTVLLQGLWIGARMGPDRLALGLGILGVFAILFTAAGFFSRTEDQDVSRLSQAGGLLLPFAFTVYFASRVDLGPHLWPVAILLATLSVGASWVGRKQGTPWLGLAASIGSLAVFGVWQLRAPTTTASAWESVAIAVGLAAIFHVFVELDREPTGTDGPAPAAIIAGCGFLAVLVLASIRSAESGPWVWLVGWLALAVLLYRHAAFPERAFLQILASLGVAAGLSLAHLIHEGHGTFPPAGTFLAVVVAVAAIAQAAALFRRDAATRSSADHAAAALAAVFALSLPFSRILETLGPVLALGVALVLGVLVLLVATRRGAGAGRSRPSVPHRSSSSRGCGLVPGSSPTRPKRAWPWASCSFPSPRSSSGRSSPDAPCRPTAWRGTRRRSPDRRRSSRRIDSGRSPWVPDRSAFFRSRWGRSP
jgi:hypothetical protein